MFSCPDSRASKFSTIWNEYEVYETKGIYANMRVRQAVDEVAVVTGAVSPWQGACAQRMEDAHTWVHTRKDVCPWQYARSHGVRSAHKTHGSGGTRRGSESVTRGTSTQFNFYAEQFRFGATYKFR